MPESGLTPPPLELVEEEELALPPLDELPLLLAWLLSSDPSSLLSPHPAAQANTKSQARMR